MGEPGSERNNPSAPSNLRLPWEPAPFTLTQNKDFSFRTPLSQADLSLKSLSFWLEKLQATSLTPPTPDLCVKLVTVTMRCNSWQVTAILCLGCFPCCCDKISKKSNLVWGLERGLSSYSPGCSCREFAWLHTEPGTQIPSCSLHGPQAHMWCTYVHTGRTPTHIEINKWIAAQGRKNESISHFEVKVHRGVGSHSSGGLRQLVQCSWGSEVKVTRA